MKKSTIAASLAAAAVVGNAVHAAAFKPKKQAVPIINQEELNTERYRKNLSKAITIKTISTSDPSDTDWGEFERFHAFLDEAYPLIAKTLTKEVVPPANLIYKWAGKNPSLDPVALCAHQDVVPVSLGTENDWEHPAFSGDDDGEFIWGRGALDMKNHLICVMESVEELLEEGFQPERDVYLLFGDNEEIVASKENGATAIMKVLQSRGVHLDCLLDEGGATIKANVKGVLNDKTLIGIGIAEKGYADIEITVTANGGHSSQPPAHTALGQLADVIKDLEGNQFKASFNESTKALMNCVSRNFTYPVRLISCNLPLLYPVMLPIFKKVPLTASMIRTTTGITMAQGSPAANVLPQRASITVNFRAMPGTSTDDIVSHIKKVVRNKNIEIKVLKKKEASSFSPTDTRGFKTIARVATGIDQNSIVAPFLVMAGTDACYYEPICQNIYRYAPFKAGSVLFSTTHGTNERMPISAINDALLFFKNYIRQVSDEF